MENISIVILCYNNLDYTKKCIESIREYTKKGTYELVLIDNNSTDGTKKWLEQQQDMKVIYNKKNLGFPKGCNQGIEAAQKDNDILLLNNDVIVTKNWLSNLRQALYSDEKIGAVGPVSNSISYNQKISVQYENTEKMQEFAEQYNHSNKAKWQKTIKLIGYCFLIKREVISKVGLLEEIFSPGNYEDDDYSLRIIEAGYELILCKDTFIHHFGSVSFKPDEKQRKLLIENSIKFEKKWGFKAEEKITLDYLYEKFVKEDDAKVFEFNCGCGATLINIKNSKPGIIIDGYDDNLRAFNISSNNFQKEEFYDYIFISTPKNKDELIKYIDKLQSMIHKNTKIYVKGLNTRCIKNIINLLGEENKLNFSLYDELIEVINNSNLKLKYITLGKLDEKEKKIYEPYVKKLEIDFDNVYLENYYLELEVGEKYILKGSNKYYENNVFKTEIKFSIISFDDDIESDEDISHLLNALIDNKIDENDMVNCITKYSINKQKVLNKIAVYCYMNKIYDYIIPFLTKAYEINKDDYDTVYNLISILSEFGEKELALNYYDNYSKKDEKLQQLLEQF